MTTLRLILGDQLSHDISALSDLDKDKDIVLMMEVMEECAYVPHHKQKLVLILSAMRHFASELQKSGTTVDYVQLDDPSNTGNFTDEVNRAFSRHKIKRLIVTEPGEWRVQKMFQNWSKTFKIPIEIRTDYRFFAPHKYFSDWAKGRRLWRMEHFYHDMRRDHQILMDGDKPAGGAWNFDIENRKRLPNNVIPPQRKRFSPDPITRKVMILVEKRFDKNFGALSEFAWPVTRQQALVALDDFITYVLPNFGAYQDAMKGGAPFMYHSLLAPALNIGLLNPQEVCRAAETAWRKQAAPLNAVEGFIRQILGWREYVRGVYWSLMPSYAETNTLSASRPLPDFFWTGKTDLKCLAEAISSTERYAYSHHIQRLMLTGNFALLAGIAPREIERWYLAVYVDAFEWVEMPNTLGMAIFADGGRMASKPYAASGAYIDRMSDFCSACAFDVKQKAGAAACPFNRLYWAFLIKHKDTLSGNPRLAMPYRTLAGWTTQRQNEILADADDFLSTLK
jgi:deoxyribodipyrimidine photolyase-related protein